MPFWSRRTPRRARTASVHAGAPAPIEALFDSLESRLALYADPFLSALPTTAMMTDARNTVVRMETNQGTVDIELYDVAGPTGGSNAPITTTNFLNYVRTGRYDNTFFHRLIQNFVLQGGGFSLKDPLPTGTPKYDAVQTDATIQNEFDAHRSNVAMTLAMAKIGGNPNSATSQFFFNLADNASNLDNQNGGFTVFAHVIQGWSVITGIAALSTRNVDTFLGGNGLFTDVPVITPSDTAEVTIVDMEVIKPKNQDEFYTLASYYPEGFRSGRSTDTIELVNSDPNAGTVYQIVARFEKGQRDKVVAQGFLFAGGHVSIPMYRGGDSSVNLVRGGTPFGYEIRSSKPIGASLTHTDFGATGEQSFTQAGPYSASNLETWDFANGQKGPGLASFLVWMNMSDQPSTVVATFYSDLGTPFTISQVLQPFRRGGFDVNQLPLVANGLYSVHIVSSQPIAAALSQYRIAPGRADTEPGVISGGVRGFLPSAMIPSSGQSTISAVFGGTGPGTVVVNLDFVLSDGTVLSAPNAFTLSSSTPRADVDLSTLNGALPRDQFFTIRYRVQNSAAPVSLSYTSITNGDTMTTPFLTASTETVFFGAGFTDPANAGTETISIYNPFTDGSVAFSYRLKFHFANSQQDDVIDIPTATLAAGHRVDIAVRSLSQVLTKIQSDARFHNYSITIETSATRNGVEIPGGVFAQLTRIDPTGGGVITAGPSLDNSMPAIFANDSRFGA